MAAQFVALFSAYNWAWKYTR